MYRLCSAVILIGFYGNERANKGLERSVTAASDVVDTLTLIRNQVRLYERASHSSLKA